MSSFVSHNGKIIPLEKAAIPVTNLEFSYGFGVYETIKLRNRVLYFLDRHIDRLLNSAQVISLTHPFTRQQLMRYASDLVKVETRPSINIKILLIGAQNKKDVNLYIMPLAPLFPKRQLYRDGADLTTTHYERYWPNAKTLNMMGSYIAYRQAKQNNCYDTLLINRHDEFTEGTRTNFYLIKNKTIYRPPTKDILPGVTQDTVLQVARKNGYKLIIKKLKVKDLDEYDGAFITSTSTKIMPVRKIILEDKNHTFPITKQVKNLIKLYSQFLKNYSSNLK